MLEIDGSEGGGQVIRSALTLSVTSGKPVRLVNVRGSRPNPGVRHQHAAAIRLAAAVSDATVTGGDVGDDAVEFVPSEPTGGEVTVDVGTAGSVTLLADVVLPLAASLPRPLSVTLTGGTDVKWSPPIDYLRRVKLPLLRRLGLVAALDVDRRGFYPAGGGRIRLTVGQSTVDSVSLDVTPDVTDANIYATCSATLADAEVAARAAEAASRKLEENGVSITERTESLVETASTGAAIVVRLDGESSEADAEETSASDDEMRSAVPHLKRYPCAGFSRLGERGKPAEAVGREASEDALEFVGEGGAVDVHMADQLLVFLALVGGRVAVPSVTDHVATSVSLLREFGFEVDVVERTHDVLVSSPVRDD